MSDFDFDEIDKAVNSALNGQTASNSSRSSEVNRELTVPSRDSAGSTGRSLESPPRSEADPDATAKTPEPETTTPAPAISTSMPTPTSTSTSTTAPSTETESDVDINSTVNSIVEGIDTSTPESVDAQPAAGAELNTDSDSASTKPELPTRRSGRFMDVVHPSSDMRTESMTPRKAPTIKPLETDGIESPVVEDKPVEAVEPVETIAAAEATEQTADSSSLSNGIKPDEVPPPIDLDKPVNTELTSQIDNLLSDNDTDSTPAPTPTPTPAPTQETPPPQTEAPAVQPQTEEEGYRSDGLDFEETVDKFKSMQSEPQTSPFLEGVAVDKRPLGNGDDPDKEAAEILQQETMSPQVSVESSKNDKKSGFDEELKHPDDVTAADVLPDELDNKLVSIESSVDGGKKSPEAKEKVDTPKETAGPTSIAKQYKEKQRTDDKDASSDIFDTKNYHKPIKDDTKSKKMSPLIITLIIVVVILLIAGGVFAAWWAGLFTLPF